MVEEHRDFVIHNCYKSVVAKMKKWWLDRYTVPHLISQSLCPSLIIKTDIST
jgi:hypothetical protein